jgi:hypothetical protein
LQAMGKPPSAAKEVNARYVSHPKSIFLRGYGLTPRWR